MTNLRISGIRAVTLGCLLAAPALVACGSSTSTKAAAPAPAATTAPATGGSALSGKITVFAASSLTGSFTAIGKAFEAAHPGTSVVFSFGSSSTLATQITSGAPADVFASASPKNMASVVSAGDASAPATFATNTAEIAVAPASKAKVTSIQDLAASGVKVALCQEQVPCGALATSVLAKAKVTVTPVTRGVDVKSVLATVTSGEVDAAVVYVTDVKAAGSAVVGVPIPAADNASTAYPIATVKSTKNAALANAFDAYVLSPAGQTVLAQAGFAAP